MNALSARPKKQRLKRSIKFLYDLIKPAFYKTPYFSKAGLALRLKPQDQNRLGIGGPDKRPSIVKFYTYPVNSNGFILIECILRLFNDPELDLIRTVKPYLRGRKDIRHIP